jgi:hypothetical protein
MEIIANLHYLKLLMWRSKEYLGKGANLFKPILIPGTNNADDSLGLKIIKIVYKVYQYRARSPKRNIC